MTISTEIINSIFGAVVGIFSFYVLSEITKLKKSDKNTTEIVKTMAHGLSKLKFPSTTEIAKEVMKIRLPISDVPPEMLEQYKMAEEQLKQHEEVKTYTG